MLLFSVKNHIIHSGYDILDVNKKMSRIYVRVTDGRCVKSDKLQSAAKT
jgi:hypothetical protein